MVYGLEFYFLERKEKTAGLDLSNFDSVKECVCNTVTLTNSQKKQRYLTSNKKQCKRIFMN